ncbi:MAG: formate/nitrite transporter family protein [Clostridiales bacterium]|nr:formate/nitrite transporter family protein [Clostridiales bacterium]
MNIYSFGAVASSIASHSLQTVSAARFASGLLFPFWLAMLMILGAELFTGNCLIVISVLNKDASVCKMLKNCFVVYAGNFAGAVTIAAVCAYSGEFSYTAFHQMFLFWSLIIH